MWKLLVGDCLDMLWTLPSGAVQCCVTSPPYWGLRDYGVDGQIGLEDTPDAHVAKLVEVFGEVRRVLRDDGTLWLNYGDAYAGGGGFSPGSPANIARESGSGWGSLNPSRMSRHEAKEKPAHARKAPQGIKPKDLIGLPWMLAFALRADGWWLRSDIIWSKANPMPESVRDRPTRAHEYVFLLSKSARYFYDAEAVREEPKPWNNGKLGGAPSAHESNVEAGQGYVQNARKYDIIKGANARTVWTINPRPFPEAHFATFPPELAERCIKAGSAKGDTVLDPFAGAGTTLLVAERLGRDSIGIELNPTYAEIAERRIRKADPFEPVAHKDGTVQRSLF